MDARILLITFLCVQQLSCPPAVMLCPENASPSGNECRCDYGHTRINLPGGRFKCEKCIECGICMGRNVTCNSRHPEGTVQGCISAPQGFFVKYGKIERCRPECGKNEQEVKKCGCNQNRLCICLRNFYKDSSEGKCKKRCTKCVSPVHKRVPDHLGCSGMPLNEKCVELSPYIPDVLSSTPDIVTTTAPPPPPTTTTTTPPPPQLTTTPSPPPTTTTPTVPTPTNKRKLNKIESNVNIFFTYIIPILAVICVLLIIFLCCSSKRRKAHDHNEQQIPLNPASAAVGPGTVTTETTDPNSNESSSMNFEQINEDIPDEILDWKIEHWSYRFPCFTLACAKVTKDSYIELVFQNDPDLQRIITCTNYNDSNGCKYETLFDHVKTRQPNYTLRNLLMHMLEIKNSKFTEMLVDDITKNREKYSREAKQANGDL